MRTEISAGGLVLKDPKFKGPDSLANPGTRILMIEVKNLEGEVVWTFPKGHLEKGETALDAAVREVWEETGWKALAFSRSSLKSTGSPRPFRTVRYTFKRKGKKVSKTVVWYLMRPVLKKGSRDPEEVRKVVWKTLRSAAKTVVYGSDKELLEKLLGKKT